MSIGFLNMKRHKKTVLIMLVFYACLLLCLMLLLFPPVRYVIIRAAETLLVHRKLNFPHWDNLIFHCGVKGIKCLCLIAAFTIAFSVVFVAVRNNVKRIRKMPFHIRSAAIYTAKTIKQYSAQSIEAMQMRKISGQNGGGG